MPATHTTTDDRNSGRAPAGSDPLVTDEILVLRNYDGSGTHDLTVRLVDASEDVAFERAFTLAPLETISVGTRLRRAVYRVEARLDGDRHASADCLVGSGPTETAVIETGNGLLSVVER
jgi:hypothetical protein